MKETLQSVIDRHGLADEVREELAYFGYEPATPAQTLRCAKAVALRRLNEKEADRICIELQMAAGNPTTAAQQAKRKDFRAYLRTWLGETFGDWHVEAVFNTGSGWRMCKAVVVCTKCGFRRTYDLRYLRDELRHNCERERHASLEPITEQGERIIR